VLLEGLWQPCLLQNDIGGVTRFDVVIDREPSSRNWTFPNFVVTAPLPDKPTAISGQNILHKFGEASQERQLRRSGESNA
jgi:hypothetical protein